MTQPVIKKPWERVRVQMVPSGESRTDQSHGDQTNINAVVARFKRTGMLPPAQKEAVYADVTGLQADLTTLIENARSTLSIAEEFAQGWKPKVDDPPPAPAPDPVPDPAPQPA